MHCHLSSHKFYPSHWAFYLTFCNNGNLCVPYTCVWHCTTIHKRATGDSELVSKISLLNTTNSDDAKRLPSQEQCQPLKVQETYNIDGRKIPTHNPTLNMMIFFIFFFNLYTICTIKGIYQDTSVRFCSLYINTKGNDQIKVGLLTILHSCLPNVAESFFYATYWLCGLDEREDNAYTRCSDLPNVHAHLNCLF